MIYFESLKVSTTTDYSPKRNISLSSLGDVNYYAVDEPS